METFPFWETIAADLVANKLMRNDVLWNRFTLIKKILWSFLFHPRFECVFWYRVNRLLYVRDLPGRDLLSAWRMRKFGNDISYYAIFGPGLFLVHLSDIVVGGKAIIGARAIVLNGVTIGSRSRTDLAMPHVGDDVYFGSGSKILGNVRIGDRVTIGVMTLCMQDVPDHTIAFGSGKDFIIAGVSGGAGT